MNDFTIVYKGIPIDTVRSEVHQKGNTMFIEVEGMAPADRIMPSDIAARAYRAVTALVQKACKVRDAEARFDALETLSEMCEDLLVQPEEPFDGDALASDFHQALNATADTASDLRQEMEEVDKGNAISEDMRKPRSSEQIIDDLRESFADALRREVAQLVPSILTSAGDRSIMRMAMEEQRLQLKILSDVLATSVPQARLRGTGLVPTHIELGPEAREVLCDCGGRTARTPHAEWCSSGIGKRA